MNIKELVNTLEQSLPSIDEPSFRNYYLPFFLGQVPKEQISTILATWIVNVAKNTTTSVNVIDPTTQETLFVVPALIDLTRLSITDRNHFEHAIGVLGVYSSYQPELAEHMFRKEMQIASANSIEIAPNSRWEGMLKFYGLATPSTEAPTSRSSLMEELGF